MSGYPSKLLLRVVNSKIRVTLLLLLVSGLFYVASFVTLSTIDKGADSYFSESIKSATVAYAVVRGINAVVSVVKESHLELAPAGVGITIAAGQLLDPIDDMTERLSSLVVAAIVSLGMQKLGYELGSVISFKAVALLLLLMLPLLWLKGDVVVALTPWLIKCALILLLLRFLLPLSAWVGDSLYSNWLQPEIEDSLKKLSLLSKSYDSMQTLAPGESRGFFASMTAGGSDKIGKIRAAYLSMIKNAENIISALLKLMTAYLALFVVQVILLPIAMLWLLVALFKSHLLDTLTTSLAGKLVIA
ncbi:MAG: hypothetical protein Q9M31_08195 [Mariprofundus sp.]|nr:hypothetical protein [Mariprofundus sp.]